MNDHQYEDKKDDCGNKGHNHTFAHLYSMDGNYACLAWSLGFATCGFVVYMEVSPRMGNIWWRDDRVSVEGAIRCMVYPLSEWRMWRPDMWSGNWFIWLAMAASGALLLNCAPTIVRSYLYREDAGPQEVRPQLSHAEGPGRAEGSTEKIAQRLQAR